MSGVKNKPIRFFESDQQSIVSGGLVVIAHGLGVEPKFIDLYLVCVSDEDGYVAGDKIKISLAGSFSTAYNQSITVDSENISIRYEDAANVIAYTNKSTGVALTFTNSNWKLIVNAWA